MQTQNLLPAPHQWMQSRELFQEEGHQDFLPQAPGAKQTLADDFAHIPQGNDGIQLHSIQSPILVSLIVPFAWLCIPE